METQWKQLLEKLKQAGDDLRKETQRMVDDLRDPKKQEKLKDSLRDFGQWAKGTAEEAAHKLETAVNNLEDTVQRASDRVTGQFAGTKGTKARKSPARGTVAKKRTAGKAKPGRKKAASPRSKS